MPMTSMANAQFNSMIMNDDGRRHSKRCLLPMHAVAVCYSHVTMCYSGTLCKENYILKLIIVVQNTTTSSTLATGSRREEKNDVSLPMQ